jgi:hypothetical protein
MTSTANAFLKRRRMQILEPVFANIRTHKKMNRFTLRTKEKVILLKLDFVSIKKSCWYGNK